MARGGNDNVPDLPVDEQTLVAATDPMQTPKIHSNSNKNGADIRFHLGGKRLRYKQWRTLKRDMSEVSTALLACTSAVMPDDATLFSPCRFHLGNLTYTIVQLYRGAVVVRLQEFFQRRPEFRRVHDEDDLANLVPGKKWLNLSSEQWHALEAHGQRMDAVLESVVEKTEFLTDKLLRDIAEL
ncbi:Transcriptional coactivator [Branchiostoma belcheri]|nr:Transcriptional coactivator [Branchiostoma belcheri]